jgi:putative membrane protein insertion efficiency factor
VKLIENYQKNRSDETHYRCRHRPTCSEYAKQAYQRYNFFHASFLTTKRLLKCNRLFKPKYDPVPIKYSKIVKDARKLMKKNKNKNVCIDATCGNGHDTIFLSKYYKEVHSFDIQKLAITRTEKKLYYINNVKLYNDDFNNIPNYDIKPDLIIFNLGFLPGSNRKVKTQDYTPELAIKNCYNMLNDDGLLIICSYRAHDGGMDEYNKIINEIKDLNYSVKEKYKNNEALIVIKKESHN